MGDLGFNKIAAAILATGLGYMLLKEASHLVMHVEAPSAPAYALEIPEPTAAGVVEAPLPFPQADWVAAMNVSKGETVFKKCTSCHNADNGGGNGTGPNLWAIVGAQAGGKDGFGYSGALTKAGLTWDFETLDGFLEKPSKYLKGTNMNFIGLKKTSDRAAVIAYLNAQSGAPLPAPAVAVVETEVAEVMDGEAVMEKTDAVMENSAEGVDAAKDVMDAAKDVMDAPKELLEAAKDEAEKAASGNEP